MIFKSNQGSIFERGKVGGSFTMKESNKEVNVYSEWGKVMILFAEGCWPFLPDIEGFKFKIGSNKIWRGIQGLT